MGKKLGVTALLAVFAALLLPGAASAASVAELASTAETTASELNMTWVAVGTVLVFLMQAGFMFLEIGFSRQKNAGTGVAKILVNLAICTLAWWAIGYGVAEGGGNDFFGDSGFFFHFGQSVAGEAVNGETAMLMLYGLAFCAVSLAIVWGTTLERIKFGAYVIYAVVFGAIVYPLVAHAVWGGGLLGDIGGKPVMDFAGSSVVHLTGAVGAFAALLLLGPRKGKYDASGKPRVIPGHSMPLVGLGVIILWIGWFGFNGGSTFGTAENLFGEVMLNTQLAAAAGVIGASIAVYLKSKSLDVGMAGNGAIAGLVAITAPSGFVEYWAAPIIGLFAGLLVVYRGPGDRQAPRRPRRRPLGARPGRYLGNALRRHLRLFAFDQRRRVARRLVLDIRRRTAQLDPRTVGGSGSGGRLHLRRRLRDLDRDVRLHQRHDRAAGRRRGGGSRPRHQFARDVRVPGAVHSTAGVLDRDSRLDGSRTRTRAHARPNDRDRTVNRRPQDEKDRSVHSP